MGLLTDRVLEEISNNRAVSAGHLINSVTELKQQFIETESTMSDLKIKIKASVQTDVWVEKDIANLNQAMELSAGIRQQGILRKKELRTIKLLLKNSIQKEEIQTEIDNLIL